MVFKTINIDGEKLTNQDLWNAVYSGTWVTDVKRYFNKNNCPVFGIANNYINGSPIRPSFVF